MGYVGPIVTTHLRKSHRDAELVGLDTGFFGACCLNSIEQPEWALNAQLYKDVRDVLPQDLAGFDAVIHLAALSNDPLGSEFQELTIEINRSATLNLAEMAKSAGVQHFVFASSCSVYGAGGEHPRTESHPVVPLTAYAESKIGAEQDLEGIAGRSFLVTSLRFATACGPSPRLRLDLVLNDFVAAALSSGEIQILSDGTPSRPLIDVRDMALAIEWALTRKIESGGPFLIMNTGSNSCNASIAQLADAVARVVPGTKILTNPQAPADKRSYRVDFGLFSKLAPNHTPRLTLIESITALFDQLRDEELPTGDFRKSKFSRLHALLQLKRQSLTSRLYWDRLALEKQNSEILTHV